MQTDKDRQLAPQKQKTLPQSQSINLFQQISHIANQDSQMLSKNPSNDQQVHSKIQQNAHIQAQQMQQENDDYQYDQYQQYDENGQYMIDEPSYTFQRVQSSQKNTQCSMEHLIKIIEKDIQRVMLLTGFDRNWSFILYHTCEWQITNVENVIDQKLTSHKMVNFKPLYAQISTVQSQCLVCCSENQILLRNFCGHEFCLTCWKDHLKQRMETFYLDPFPFCLDESCKTKTSPFILELIGLNDESFNKLYLRTLCRSYAVGNNSVKMCKGREGKSCDQCFKVNKLFQRLQCENCGNILCAKCGEDYHHPSQCYEQKNWRNIVQNSTSFMTILDYKTCPNCQQAVQKSVGCNSVICKCQTMFCYICGQKWLPNHSQHGHCYRKQEIDALQKQRKKKFENNKEYTYKLEKSKQKIDTFIYKIKEVQKIDPKSLQLQMMQKFKILSNQLDYLEPLLKTLKVSLMGVKGYVMSLHFNENQMIKVKQQILESFIKNAYDFLIYELPTMLQAFSDKPIVSKKAGLLRKDNINPQEQLAKSRILMLESMKNIQKYIHQ